MHGCFWHRHGCKNSVIPKTNTEFWKDKLFKNIERDRIVAVRLKNDKWVRKVIWECEIEKNPYGALKNIKKLLHIFI